MKSGYLFDVRAKQGHKTRLAPYTVQHWAYSMKGAMLQARKLNDELIGFEIWRVTESATGETECL